MIALTGTSWRGLQTLGLAVCLVSWIGCQSTYRRDSSSAEEVNSADRSAYAYRSDPRFPSAADAERSGVWFEEARVSGGISSIQVARAAARHVSAVETCRRGVEDAETRLEGRLVLALTIGPRGRIESADVRETSIHDRRFRRCLLEAVRTWRMPAPEGDSSATAQLPLNVHPAGGRAR